MKYLKWVKKNVESLKDKNVIITGATGSIGKNFVKYLAYLDANIYLAVRNLEKGETLREELRKINEHIDIYVYYLDISDSTSIDNFVDMIKDVQIDYLINNAGIYNNISKKNSLGVEIHYFTNFIGPSLLTLKLLPILKKCKGKIITTGSISYFFKNTEDIDIYKYNKKNKTKIYGQTKRLLMLMMLYLKKEYPEIDITIIQPGITGSSLFDSIHGGFSHFFNKTVIPLMHLVFFSNEKASLSLIYSLRFKTPYGCWIGPRGLFHIWGYPKVNRLRKNILSEDEISRANSIVKKFI